MVEDEATSMFAGQPQPVEIHHRGIWYSGELIGWRHESGGRVSARVRCRIDKLRHSAWVDLGRLRLPDPAHPPRREPYPAPLPRDAENRDGADATRPHAMLAGISSRPAKPAHATTPPASEGQPPSYESSVYEPSVYEAADYGIATYEEPVAYEPASDSYGYGTTYEASSYEPSPYESSASWADEPAPVYESAAQPAIERDWSGEPRRRPRRNEQLRRHDAYLSLL